METQLHQRQMDWSGRKLLQRSLESRIRRRIRRGTDIVVGERTNSGDCCHLWIHFGHLHCHRMRWSCLSKTVLLGREKKAKLQNAEFLCRFNQNLLRNSAIPNRRRREKGESSLSDIRPVSVFFVDGRERCRQRTMLFANQVKNVCDGFPLRNLFLLSGWKCFQSKQLHFECLSTVLRFIYLLENRIEQCILKENAYGHSAYIDLGFQLYRLYQGKKLQKVYITVTKH